MSALPAYLTIRGLDLELRVKAVPGARRSELVGALGDRLKIRVSAPPEDGKANAAIVAVIAKALGVNERAVELTSGHANPLKAFVLRGSAARAAEIAATLAELTSD